MSSESSYGELLRRFQDQAVVTIAAGTTCGCLGDERNLREFLVADEAASVLRRAGHVVFFLLIDDSFEPLNGRQLRLAVGKDEAQIERYRHWCGKPIGSLPDPWECHESFAAHFEAELLERLHRLGCHPTLVSTGKLYARGVYARYVTTVLERSEEVRAVLNAHCHGYSPEKLLWVLCPHCATLDETRIERIGAGTVAFACDRCERHTTLPFDEVLGKLNWKLDCAARWQILQIDVEPFGKEYLDPLAGSFVVSRAFAQEFFGGRPVLPLPYGQVKMDRYCSYKLLEALPAGALRALFVDRPQTDIHLSRPFVLTAASRYEVAPQLTYLDFVKQLLPIWILTPERLTGPQRDLVTQGMAFSRYFLDSPIGFELPTRAAIQDEAPTVLDRLHTLLLRVVQLRADSNLGCDDFHRLLQCDMALLGEQKKQVMHRLRLVTGQQKGLPASRFLFLMPLNYLQLLIDLLELHLTATLAARFDESILTTV